MKLKITIILILISTVLTINAQYVNKWMSVGTLHNWYSEIGSEREHGFQPIQQFGMQWPAQYNYQDMQCAKGLWIGAKNFTEVEGSFKIGRAHV